MYLFVSNWTPALESEDRCLLSESRTVEVLECLFQGGGFWSGVFGSGRTLSEYVFPRHN